MHVEVAVIGGGVNGLAIARELAGRYRAKVAVFDDRGLGAASGAAAGLLGAQIEAASLPEAQRAAVFPLLREGRLLHEFLDLYTREIVGLGTGYRRAGALHVARDEAELDALEARYAWQRAYGDEVVRVSARHARRLEPTLSRSIAGAIYLPDEAVVDPLSLLHALRRSCDALGVLSVPERVRRVESGGGRACGVRTAGGTWWADAVVVAAGGRIAGLEGLPRALGRVKAAPASTVLLRGEGTPERVVVSAEGYLVPWGGGNLALGSNGGDGDAAGDALAALYTTTEIVPALASYCIWHSRLGYRPMTADGMPWAGRTELGGLFVATGNVRNGLLLAPTTAANVADLVGGRAGEAWPFGGGPRAPAPPERPCPAFSA